MEDFKIDSKQRYLDDDKWKLFIDWLNKKVSNNDNRTWEGIFDQFYGIKNNGRKVWGYAESTSPKKTLTIQEWYDQIYLEKKSDSLIVKIIK